MNVLTELRENVFDHKRMVLVAPFDADLDEGQARWSRWWSERYVGVTSKTLRDDGWLKVFPLQFAAMWSDPDFWSLLRGRPTEEVTARFIAEKYFPITADILKSCLSHASGRLFSGDPEAAKQSKCELCQVFLLLVDRADIRKGFIHHLLRRTDEEGFWTQESLRSRLEQLSEAQVDRVFAKYLMFPRDADKRELIIRLGLGVEELKDLVKVAREFASDCEDVLARPGARYFPDKRIAKKSGAPIKEANIQQVEKFVDQLLADPTLTGYGMAKGENLTPSNLKLVRRARQLVELRHGIKTKECVELRDGKRIGRKPRRNPAGQTNMGS